MCILSLIERKTQIQGIKLREDEYRGFKGQILYESISILQEIYEMYNLGMIACKSKSSEGHEALLGWTDVAPNRLLLTPMGKRYYKVMGLQDIPKKDIKEVARYLS